MIFKLKTKKSAFKRFKRVGTKGNLFKHKQSHMRHFLVRKSTKRKRQLRSLKFVSKSNVSNLKRLLPYCC